MYNIFLVFFVFLFSHTSGFLRHIVDAWVALLALPSAFEEFSSSAEIVAVGIRVQGHVAASQQVVVTTTS
jgi:hypothetical protein